MAMEEYIELLCNLLSKASYNKITECYLLSWEDYLSLNLSFLERPIINKICEEMGIRIQISYGELPDVKCIELFGDYNDIQKKIKQCLNLEDRKMLEKRRDNLRNIIIENNFDFITSVVHCVLNRQYNLGDISTRIDMDDIYQLGYEIFIRYVDNYELDKEKIKNDLYSILMWCINFIFNNNKYVSVEKLAEIFNMSQEMAKLMLNLDSTLEPLYLDEKINNIILCDDPLFKHVYDDIFKEYIMRLIDTLPVENQKQTLILYFGLDGEGQHTLEEISEKLNICKGSVVSTLKKALGYFEHPVRLKYLAKLLNRDICISFDIYEEIMPMKREIRRLEKFLLGFISRDEMIELISSMNEKHRNSLLIYLGYKDMVCENGGSNICEILDDREKGLAYLRNRLTEKYVVNNKNEFVDDYFDYLMHNYVTRTRKK